MFEPFCYCQLKKGQTECRDSWNEREFRESEQSDKGKEKEEAEGRYLVSMYHSVSVFMKCQIAEKMWPYADVALFNTIPPKEG